MAYGFDTREFIAGGGVEVGFKNHEQMHFPFTHLALDELIDTFPPRWLQDLRQLVRVHFAGSKKSDTTLLHTFLTIFLQTLALLSIPPLA